jgi:hypothetical protein
LNWDKQLVHISLVGFSAATKIRVGQFHVSAPFLLQYIYG